MFLSAVAMFLIVLSKLLSAVAWLSTNKIA